MYENKKGCVKMEENKENVNIPNTENTKETVNEKTETVKKENNESKNFFPNFFKTPYDEIKKVAQSPKSYFIIILVSFLSWIAANLIGGIISIVDHMLNGYYSNILMYFKNSFDDILDLFVSILTPAIIISVLSLIVYLFMKNKKKNYLTIASTLIIAYIPVISASIVSLLGYINYNIAKLTNTYSSFCSVITAVLTYFAIKSLYSEEDDNKSTITYLITMGIYFGFVFILKIFGLYI